MAKGFRFGPQLFPDYRLERVAAGGGADSPIELRRPQQMKEPPVHRRIVQYAQRAPVGVGQDRLGSKLAADRGQALVNLIQRRGPRDALEILRIAPASTLRHSLPS